jgi:hypothetical protein
LFLLQPFVGGAIPIFSFWSSHAAKVGVSFVTTETMMVQDAQPVAEIPTAA